MNGRCWHASCATDVHAPFRQMPEQRFGDLGAGGIPGAEKQDPETPLTHDRPSQSAEAVSST